MSTLQKIRPATSTTSGTTTGNWTDLFPADVGQQQSSTTFVRKLVVVGVSQILYLRTEIPEEAFESVDLDGLPLKIIKGSHEQSKKICTLLSNALNGVKRKYLSEMTVALYTDRQHPEEAHETYTFKFVYAPDGEATLTIDAKGDKSVFGKEVQIEDVKKKTRRLLRKIIETTQSLSDQSDDVFITVLLKWNADTPRDYEPSGFMPAKYMFNLHKTDQYEAKVGSVKTNFHAVATKIRVVEGIAHSQQSQPLSQPSALNRETIRPLTPQQGKRDRDENVAPEDHSDISSVVSSTMKSAVSAKSSVVGKRPWPEEVSEVPLPPKRPAPAVALDADMMEEGGHGGGKINRPVSPRFSTAMSPRYPPV